MTWGLALTVLGIALFGGLVKGVAGFGYAIASTALLATVLDPADAGRERLPAFGTRRLGVHHPAVGRPARRGWFVDRRFTEGPAAKVGLGLLSGGVFGASNVAVQVVAYLDHLDLDRGTFVGVIGVSAGGRIRAHVPESHQTGGTVVLLSVIAARLTLGGLGVL